MTTTTFSGGVMLTQEVEEAAQEAAQKVKRTHVRSTTPEVNQTTVIRDHIKAGSSNEEIIEDLTLLRNAAWAKSRYALYEKAYGSRGCSDPKLQQ